MKETIILSLIAILIIIALVNMGLSPTLDDVNWQEAKHVVRRGETLWSISKLYCSDSVDRREWIDEIKQLNNIGDTIYEGDEIIVLVEVTEK